MWNGLWEGQLEVVKVDLKILGHGGADIPFRLYSTSIWHVQDILFNFFISFLLFIFLLAGIFYRVSAQSRCSLSGRSSYNLYSCGALVDSIFTIS